MSRCTTAKRKLEKKDSNQRLERRQVGQLCQYKLLQNRTSNDKQERNKHWVSAEFGLSLTARQHNRTNEKT